MPKRASVNTQKPVSKRKKSTGASATNAEPVEQIDYDLLAAAILRQTQNSSNSSMTQGSSYSVDHTNLSVCDIYNTNVDDQEVSTLDVATQQRVNNTATKNLASLSPPAESQQPTDSTASVAKLVNALLNQDAGRLSGNTTFTQSTNKNSSGTALHLTNSAHRLLQASLAPSTRKAYQHSWQLLLTWANSISLPIPSITLCNFMGHFFKPDIHQAQ
ncbi:uncharacterized protein LOC125678152 isoform X2 [Ostrea edulis]|uniref:uncharacterized protein LOC125678152 isoform X2 n=1 Tax=Ostrea edulis TaxID=37623 RepID=UPI002094593C|nr:uncharacterized protein LOC125678152 isoform X2 [Ostrea edulis]